MYRGGQARSAHVARVQLSVCIPGRALSRCASRCAVPSSQYAERAVCTERLPRPMPPGSLQKSVRHAPPNTLTIDLGIADLSSLLGHLSLPLQHVWGGVVPDRGRIGNLTQSATPPRTRTLTPIRTHTLPLTQTLISNPKPSSNPNPKPNANPNSSPKPKPNANPYSKPNPKPNPNPNSNLNPSLTLILTRTRTPSLPSILT